MSNYPPGVTGNEWEIAGYPPCGHMGCGHADDLHTQDSTYLGGGVQDIEVGGPCTVDDCECEGYTPYSDHDEYEPDLEAGT